MNEFLKCDLQMKASEQHSGFPVVLLIMLFEVVKTFESVDKILQIKAIEQYFSLVLFKAVLTF